VSVSICQRMDPNLFQTQIKRMRILKKILYILDREERRKAILVLAMILISALMDMLGVMSVMPFMAVLANPEVIETNGILKAIFEASHVVGITTSEDFIFAVGVFVFLMLIVSLAVKALTIFLQTRFVFMREYSIGHRLVEGYLNQPYSWFLTRNSADLSKNILSEVSQVITYALGPVANILASGAIVLTLLLLLVMVDTNLALTIGLVLGSAYGLIFKFNKGLLKRIGNERVAANEARFIALNECFGATKEVKISNLEHVYLERFAVPAATYSRHLATTTIIANIPRFVLELIAFGGLLLVVLYLMVQSGDFASAIPIITLYAFAGYRLMPSLQQLYSSATQLRFAGSALDALISELKSTALPPSLADRTEVTFKESITLNNVSYQYPTANNAAIRQVMLTVPAKSKVGFVGTTGGGKTTCVDLISALLQSNSGSLEVDGQIINDKNSRSWQSKIGYVPQQICLIDDTVAANIAFGVAAEQIDMASVERAARIANLHKFVVEKLPQQYNTKVGERGIRLSGGQRQRIGIARALYHNPQVLVMDEATSALDNLTEHAVMEAVYSLTDEITVIIVAHRLSTVKTCDIIFVLENGELTGQGTFDELLKTHTNFKAMNEM
jgi:ATP-binding cassette, subfamily B, bacterial PglK